MKLYAIALLLTALPPLASAETYFCVEEQTTGFLFNATQKTWEQTTFISGGKYLVKPNKDQSLNFKWIVSEFGDSGLYAWSEHDFSDGGGIRAYGALGEFAMNKKNLRFLRTAIYGYWTDAIPGKQAGTFVEGKSTPSIGIGKCSVLEP